MNDLEADSLSTERLSAGHPSSLPYSETAVRFPCRGETLIGIVTTPTRRALAPVGLVVVVGGPQYRAGSHRQFTQLCRSVAAEGFATLRFDCTGMGDSSGDFPGFEHTSADIAAAATALRQAVPAVRSHVLWGLCDGASGALLHWEAQRDPAIAGLVLLNPWVRSPATLAQTRVKHYYAQRLFELSFWRKLLGGGVALESVGELFAAVRLAFANRRATAAVRPSARSFQERMADAAHCFAGDVVVILSGHDYTAKEFLEHMAKEPRWQARLARPGQRLDIEGADHTFSQAEDKRIVEAATLTLLQRIERRLSSAVHAAP